MNAVRALFTGLLTLTLGSCEAHPCLGVNGGCIEEDMISLTWCEDTLSVDVDHLFTSGIVTGKTMIISGPIWQADTICTDFGCTTGCCNRCGATLLMSQRTQPRQQLGTDLRLSGAVNGIDLACTGDESTLCCPIPTDGTKVNVIGAIWEDGVIDDEPRYRIDVQSICLTD